MKKNNFPISPYDNKCNGFGGVGTEDLPYILGLTLGIGVTDSDLSHDGSKVLDETDAFDLAEIDGPYIGQLNMSVVSSFCGPQGLIWGYDIANNFSKEFRFPEIKTVKYRNESIEVYDGEFLVEALKELFGTVDEKRFNIMPGSHVPFASKNVKMQGPGFLYSAIAIGIPKDRKNNACLLMEDIGMLKAEADYVVTEIIENLTKSVISVGLNQKVEYKECLVIFHKKFVPLGFTGCSLVAAPYFTLAKNAFPKDLRGKHNLEKLKKMTLQEWKKYMKYK